MKSEINEPPILHIDLGNQSLSKWLTENKYIIHSELVRYSKILLDRNLDTIQAILVSNFSDNVVFILRRDTLDITLNKAMEYFLFIEEYELCSKIRDMYIFIQNSKNETRHTKNSKQNKKQPSNGR